MAIKGAVVIDREKCKGCGVCVVNCPNKILRLAKNVNGKGYNYCEPFEDNCIGCASCAMVCPDGVISVYKVKI
jgi:2-oxoglutarate ferredoxin oxidoreductase subunit delta